MRTVLSPPTVETHGFALANDSAPPSFDLLDAVALSGICYEYCEAAVRRTTDASHGFAFEHNVRTPGFDAGREALKDRA